MIKLHFKDNGSAASFSQLALQFNTVAKEDSFSIPENLGKGFIMRSDIENGLVINLWDICMSDDLQISRIHSTSGNSYYSMLFFVEPGTLQFRFDNQENYRPADVKQYCFILSDRARADLLVEKETTLHCLSLVIPGNSLPENFRHILYKQLGLSPNGLLLLPFPLKEYQTVLDLFAAIPGDGSLMQLKIYSCMLVDMLINNLQFRSGSGHLKKVPFNQYEIMEVEKRILEKLESTIPSLASMADEFNMSESTLKRHFKMVFGKSIYVYYLEKKMDHARTLLLNKHLNVSEVSAKLGYEKVSHFISMFKKHTGYLPGKLKK